MKEKRPHQKDIAGLRLDDMFEQVAVVGRRSLLKLHNLDSLQEENETPRMLSKQYRREP